MPIDVATALAAEPSRHEASWSTKDVLLYHLGIGAGTPATDQAELRTTEFTNWREREQAGHLCRLAAAPAEPLLVWCGNSHASKTRDVGEWVPMGWHFRAMSGTDPFVIDQTVTVAFQDESQPWVQELLAPLGETLAAHGGTAGILRDQAPRPLNTWPGVDAVVVSTDNALTEDQGSR